MKPIRKRIPTSAKYKEYKIFQTPWSDGMRNYYGISITKDNEVVFHTGYSPKCYKHKELRLYLMRCVNELFPMLWETIEEKGEKR